MRYRARHVLIGLCAVLVIELGALMVMPQGWVMARSERGPFRSTPPTLAEAALRLGITPADIRRLQVRWGLPSGLRQPHSGFVSAAYQNGHVFIAPSADPEDAVGYEYLHDVWARSSPAQRARVTLLLNQFYAEHASALQPRLDELIRADVSNGSDAGAARLDELHSIACSRTRDGDLDPGLRAYCDTVLPGRAVTTKVY